MTVMAEPAGPNNIDDANTQGTVEWAFDAAAGQFDYLADGEYFTVVYRVTVTDDSTTAGTTFQDVTITINGTNDQPVISVDTGASDSADGGVTEQTGATGDTLTTLSDSGTLTLSDDDTSDTHVISVNLMPAFVHQDASGAPLTVLDTAQITALTSVLEAAFAADNLNANNTIDWDFDIADNELDFLAAGEQLVVTYEVTADDQGTFSMSPTSDEDSVSAAQIVTVTITGTNDVPTLQAESVVINDNAGQEDANVPVLGNDTDTVGTSIPNTTTPLNADAGTIEVTGTLQGADVDLTDALSYSIDSALTGVTLNSDGSTTIDLMGMVDLVRDGSSNPNDDPVFITEPASFDLDVKEYADNSMVAGMVENVDDHVVSLTIQYADAEVEDIITSSVTQPTLPPGADSYIGIFSTGFPSLVPGTNIQQVTFQFTVDDVDIDFLAEGEEIIQTYIVTVSDDAGGSVQRNINVTLTGTNDAPTITAAANVSPTLTEATAPAVLMTNGTIDIEDVDIADTVTVDSVALTVSPGSVINGGPSVADLEAM